MFDKYPLHTITEGVPKRFLYRSIYYTSILACLLLVIWITIQHYNIKDALFSWDIYQETNTISLNPYYHHIANVELAQDLYTFLPKTWYVGRHYIINNSFVYHGFLALTLFALSILLTCIQNWRGYTFYIGQALVMLVLFSFRGDEILLFNSTSNYFFIIAVSSLLGFNYLFKFLFTSVNWLSRFIVYILIMVTISLLVSYESGIIYPFHALVTSSLSVIIPIVICIIIIISVEIPYLILRISYSMASFGIISATFTLFLFIILVSKAEQEITTFVSIDAILLVVISIILGFWHFSKRIRNDLFGDDFSIKMVYVAMIVLLSGFFVFVIERGNKIIYNTLEYSTLFIIMSSTIVFMLYVIFNFFELFMQKKPVYKVAFRPKRIPYYINIITIILITTVSIRAYKPKLFYDIISGYYNEKGDFYLATGEYTLAIDTYAKSSEKGDMNAHSYYAKGVIEMNKQNNQDAKDLFRLTNQIDDIPQSYVNLGIINTWNGSHTLSVSQLKTANNLFPNNPYIRNNLGLEYAYLYMLDSATYYLIPDNQYVTTNKRSQEIKNNLIGTLIELKANILDEDDWRNIENTKPLPIGETHKQEQKHPSAAKVAYYSAFPTQSVDIDYNSIILKADKIEPYKLANAIVYALANHKPLEKETELLLDNIVLEGNEAIWVSKCYALWLFASQKYEKAFKMMNTVANKYVESQSQANKILGTWSLALNSPRLGQSYFRNIQRYIDPDLGFRKLLCAYVAGDEDDKRYYHNIVDNMGSSKDSQHRDSVFHNFDKGYVITNRQEGKPAESLLVNTPTVDAFNVDILVVHLNALVDAGKIKKAYDLLLKKLEINRYNYALNRLYITLAARQGYWFFIEQEEEELKKIIGDSEYDELINGLKERYEYDTF